MNNNNNIDRSLILKRAWQLIKQNNISKSQGFKLSWEMWRQDQQNQNQVIEVIDDYEIIDEVEEEKQYNKITGEFIGALREYTKELDKNIKESYERSRKLDNEILEEIAKEGFSSMDEFIASLGGDK